MLGKTELTYTSTPNFCDEKGNAYLVRCPNCNRENYAMNVASGICTWCMYDLNKEGTVTIEIANNNEGRIGHSNDSD